MAQRLIVLVGALALAGCKKKQEQAPSSSASDAAAAPAPAPAPGPVAAAPVDAAEPPASLPSETLVHDGLGPVLRAGPALTPEKAVVWCTRGDNGMADWVETICHHVAPGKKPVVIPVMTYADAMVIDEGVDPAADADAGVRASAARDRVAAAMVKLGAIGNAGLAAMPAPARCRFAAGELVGRDDGAAAEDPERCAIGGVTASVNPQGKVTVVSADKILFAEVFKPRARGECFLEVATVELAVDAGAKIAALAVGLAARGDRCAQVPELEVRAVRLP